jgi:hypothetical protein
LTGTFGGAMIRAARGGNPRITGGRTGPHEGFPSTTKRAKTPSIVLIVLIVKMGKTDS